MSNIELSVCSDYQMPSPDFLSKNEIDWSMPSTELVRFREHTRPFQLFDEHVHIVNRGNKRFAFIACPDAAQEILLSRSEHFPKKKSQQRLGNKAFGPGLSGTLGEQHARQHIACRPLVAPEQVKQMKAVARSAVKDAVSRWLVSGTIDLHREMSELALQITWATLLGDNVYRGRDPLVAEIIDELLQVNKSNYVSSAQVISKLIEYFISSGRKDTLPLSNPLRAIGDKQGWCGVASLSPEEVTANALVFAVAGHVTTGLTLAWGAWLLGVHPDYQDALAHCVTSHPDDRNTCTQLTCFINETMRLFPPSTEVIRDALEPITVGGQELERESVLCVSLYFLHRHNTLWEQPNFFRPQRFHSDAGRKVTRGAFLPFAGGEFGCSGMSFAFAELSTVFAQCLKQVHFHVPKSDSHIQQVELGTFLYPHSGLFCHVSPRT